MKILILNNYDLSYTFKEWQQDGQSAHQLWGITQMEDYGIQSTILPFSKFDFLKKLSKNLKILGDLDQEWRVLTSPEDYDLIYSGHYITTSFLALLRKFKIFRKPIVAISFQAPHKNLWGDLYVKLFVSGNDKIICLSEGIKGHFEKDFGIPAERLEMFEWGYDTSFHHPIPMEASNDHNQGYVLSTGKTFRDYQTLIEAFTGLNCPLEIVGYSENILESLENTPNNINITIPLHAFSSSDSGQDLLSRKLPENIKIVEKLLTTSEILAKYDRAIAVAIPLDPPTDTYNTVGLTSLVEAMCMGKAVITTENKEMGLVPEKEGIGFTVPYKDSQAWRQAAQYLVDHPEETQEMGQKARYLAERNYNLASFTQKTVQCMQSLVASNERLSNNPTKSFKDTGHVEVVKCQITE